MQLWPASELPSYRCMPFTWLKRACRRPRSDLYTLLVWKQWLAVGLTDPATKQPDAATPPPRHTAV